MTSEQRMRELKIKYAAVVVGISLFTVGFVFGRVNGKNDTNNAAVTVDAPEHIKVEIEVEEHIAVEECFEDTEPMYNFSEAELEYFAKIIYAEYGTSRDGMVLCGSVILNRIESSKFPNDLVDVIMQKNAFSTAYTKKEPSEEAMEIARLLAIDGSVLPKEVCYFKLYEPVAGTVEYTRLGNVIYSYEEY